MAFLKEQKPTGLTGIVEADETQFPVSCKGQRKGMPRPAKKHSGKTRDGGGTEKTMVVVAVQRGTSIAFDQVLERGTAVALTEALRPVLSADTVLSTDGNAAYWTVVKELGVTSGSFVSASTAQESQRAEKLRQVLVQTAAPGGKRLSASHSISTSKD